MIYSPEFWSRDTYRAKIKTPFELVVSAARAVDADIDMPLPPVQWIGRIGEPLYQCQPPTGYDDKAQAWVNTGALLNRLNYSLALAGGRMRAAHVDAAALLGAGDAADPAPRSTARSPCFSPAKCRPKRAQTLEKQIERSAGCAGQPRRSRRQMNAAMIAGLVLGAPEFQRPTDAGNGGR